MSVVGKAGASSCWLGSLVRPTGRQHSKRAKRSNPICSGCLGLLRPTLKICPRNIANYVRFVVHACARFELGTDAIVNGRNLPKMASLFTIKRVSDDALRNNDRWPSTANRKELRGNG